MKSVAVVQLENNTCLWLLEKGESIHVLNWKDSHSEGTVVLDRKKAIELGMALIQWTDGVR